MERSLFIEASPGTITFGNCTKCGADSCYTFLTVALGDKGVSDIGRITRCTECDPHAGEGR